MRSFSIDERRARLARRHALVEPTDDVTGLAEALVGLHATDPATPFLSARARVAGFTVADLEHALYDDQTLVKHLGMRRTLFVQAAPVVPLVQAGCTEAIAVTQRRGLAADVEKGGLARDGGRWVRSAERATLASLAEHGPSTGAQLSRRVPVLQAKLAYGDGKRWGGEVGVVTQVLTVLATQGLIRRGRPGGSWTSSQHRWELSEPVAVLAGPEARTALVERWLRAFGPATVDDVVWWTGLGVTKVRPALAALDVVEVDLHGRAGIVLADDLDQDTSEPWVALLPGLDVTTMGWKHRGWYLDVGADRLVDTRGNAGPTIWCDGRVVGGWTQLATGEVVTELLVDIGADAAAAIDEEAAALQAWLDGTVVSTRFPSPLARALRGSGPG